MGNTYNSRGLGRTLAAAALVGGVLLWTASTAISPAWSDDPAAYLGEVASSRNAHIASALLFLAGSLLLFPGLMATVRLLRGRRGLVGQLGASLIAIGALVGGGLIVAVNTFEAALAEGSNRSEMVAVSERSEESVGAMIGFFSVFLGGFVLGMVLLGVGLILRRAVPIPVALLVLAPVALLFAVGESRAGSIAGMLVLAAGFAGIAWKLLSIPEDDWQRPQPLPDAESPAGSPRTLSTSEGVS